jgi:Ring finger domain
MSESTPLSSRPASQDQVRRNLYETIQEKIYNSYLLISMSMILSSLKILAASYILIVSDRESESRLYTWNTISLILDCVYLILKILRLDSIKRLRNGEQPEESCFIEMGFMFHTIVYIIMQMPGNIWYWTCGDCHDKALAISVLTLANLIIGYLFLLAPALLLVMVCVCLPVAIILVMFISTDSQSRASEDMLNKLGNERYNSNIHNSDPTCTICTAEYTENEKIVIMQCDPRHFFHEDCIKKWLRINSNCPICRAPYILE